MESAGQAGARCGGGGGTVKRTSNEIKDLTTSELQVMMLAQYSSHHTGICTILIIPHWNMYMNTHHTTLECVPEYLSYHTGMCTRILIITHWNTVCT